jgi:hypothetical protein
MSLALLGLAALFAKFAWIGDENGFWIFVGCLLVCAGFMGHCGIAAWRRPTPQVVRDVVEWAGFAACLLLFLMIPRDWLWIAGLALLGTIAVRLMKRFLTSRASASRNGR